MTSNPTSPSSTGLPKWLVVSWFFIFPIGFLLVARLVYEQTYLTWSRGLQMVGFTLAHQYVFLLIAGWISIILTYCWLLVALVLVASSKRYRAITKFQIVIMSFTVITLAMSHVPYFWWQRLLVKIPGSQVSEQNVLLQAAGQGRLDTFEALLPKNADANTINSALFGAAVEGHAKVIEFLLTKNADINHIGDELGETPLMAAAGMGHPDCVKLLLAHGADVNLKTKQGKTALSLALEYKHPEIVKLIQEKGAKQSIFDAAAMGDVDAMRAFLKADPSLARAKDSHLGYSALYYSAEKGHTAAAELLIDAGADINDHSANNGWAMTPLQVAAREGHEDMAKLLITRGAEVDAVSLYGESALWLAARNRREKVVEVLLAHHANVNLKGKFKDTPLEEAAYSGSRQIAEMLIAHGADVNANAEGSGFTALHMAAEHGRTDVVELLLANGAAIDIKDRRGRTALDVAKSHGYGDISKLLSKH